MMKKSILWIKYRGSTPGAIHSIEPQSWKKKPTHFLAICQRTAQVKEYHVDRIEKLSEVPINNIIS